MLEGKPVKGGHILALEVGERFRAGVLGEYKGKAGGGCKLSSAAV